MVRRKSIEIPLESGVGNSCFIMLLRCTFAPGIVFVTLIVEMEDTFTAQTTLFFCSGMAGLDNIMIWASGLLGICSAA